MNSDYLGMVKKAQSYSANEWAMVKKAGTLTYEQIYKMPWEEQAKWKYWRARFEEFPADFWRSPQVHQAMVQQASLEQSKTLQYTQRANQLVSSVTNAPNRLALGSNQVVYNANQKAMVSQSAVSPQEIQALKAELDNLPNRLAAAMAQVQKSQAPAHFTYKGQALYKADVAELGNGRVGLKYTLANRSNCVSGQRLYIKKGDKYKEIGRVEEAEPELSQKSEVMDPTSFKAVARRSVGLDGGLNPQFSANSQAQLNLLGQQLQTQTDQPSSFRDFARKSVGLI